MLKVLEETIYIDGKTSDEIVLEIERKKFNGACLGYDEVKIDLIYPPIRMVKVTGTIFL